MLPLKLICERKDMRRNGTSLIYIQYCFSAEKRTLLNTQIAIPPEYWNKKKQCINKDLPLRFGQVDELMEDIKRMFRLAEDLVLFAQKRRIDNPGVFVKNTFKPHLDMADLKMDEQKIHALSAPHEKKPSRDVFVQLDDYILSKEKKVSRATLSVFKNLKEHLKAFETFQKKKITFDSFDYNFYDSFVDFLTFEYVQKRRKELHVGLKVNSIGKSIKQLRVFIKDRVRRKIIPSIDLTDFKVPEEETDAIYLTYEEIGTMYQTDLSAHCYLAEYRDLFVLACLTGLRFSDFSTLRPEDLRRDMLYKKQNKSDHWVVIPLRREAKQIFTEQFKEKLPRLTNPEFNRHIKTIGKLAGLNRPITFSYKKGNRDIEVRKPKYEWITSHTVSFPAIRAV